MTEDPTHAHINHETARIAWKELMRFFASGSVILVSPKLDLVETAVRMAQDDASSIQQWISEGLIARMPDALAKQWLLDDEIVWATVVKPWILVQPQNGS